MLREPTYPASPCNRCLRAYHRCCTSIPLTFVQLASLKLQFERACNQNRSSVDVTTSLKASPATSALSLDDFCKFLLDATGSSHAASSLLFRRADYGSKSEVTWDDVLPHILKKHTAQLASKRDIPYSIKMLRADPEICHQKVPCALLILMPTAQNDSYSGPSCLHDCMSAAARRMHSRHGVPRCYVLATAHVEANIWRSNGRTACEICPRISARCRLGCIIQVTRIS